MDPQELNNTRAPAGANRRESVRLLMQVAIFLVAFFALQSLWLAAQGSWLEHLVIDRATAGTAAQLIRWATPQVPAVADGSRVMAPGGGVNILNGCEGTEVLFLLIPAVCLAPISARRRTIGILGGTLFVFLVNQVRVVSLFYVRRFDPALFDLLHGIVAPLILILAVSAFFALTIGQPRREG